MKDTLTINITPETLEEARETIIRLAKLLYILKKENELLQEKLDHHPCNSSSSHLKKG